MSMTDEQPEPWARELFRKAVYEYGGESMPGEGEDLAIALIQRAFAEREEHARAERRNIISHATMGSTTGEGMSVNNICVEITRQRNKLYQAGKNSAEAELVGALEFIASEGGQMESRIAAAALKSREAGHG